MRYLVFAFVLMFGAAFVDAKPKHRPALTHEQILCNDPCFSDMSVKQHCPQPKSRRRGTTYTAAEVIRRNIQLLPNDRVVYSDGTYYIN